MEMTRRDFLGTGAAVATASATLPCLVAAQESPAMSGRQALHVPTRQANVERLFKSPDHHPNALEATPDGLWVGDQVSEKVHKLDWDTGKVLLELQTDGHNTSGLAVGAGFLWIGSNGDVNGRRPPRPTDRAFGEITQADLKTGKVVKAHRLPWGGGIHGTTYSAETNTLWVTALSLRAIAEIDVRDKMRIVRMLPAPYDRAHGLSWDSESMWVLYAGERLVRKFNPDGGRLLETIAISPTTDPDPHGMCIHRGYMYYCDAGLTAPGPGSSPGWICRFKLQ